MCVMVYIEKGGGGGYNTHDAPRTERKTTANYTYNLPKRPIMLQNTFVRNVKVNEDRSRGGLLLSESL